MKKQQAQMELYKRAGISPMGGCLPMLLQFPILWAMFRFFPASIELRQQSFLWADDLSAYDSFIDFGSRVPLIGDHLSLFALLMAVSMFFYSKMNSAQMSSDPNMAGMKFMSVWMMPVMMFFICNSLSAGLSYYYLLSNLITMLETWVIKKWFVHPEEIMAKLKASAGKRPEPSRCARPHRSRPFTGVQCRSRSPLLRCRGWHGLLVATIRHSLHHSQPCLSQARAAAPAFPSRARAAAPAFPSRARAAAPAFPSRARAAPATPACATRTRPIASQAPPSRGWHVALYRPGALAPSHFCSGLSPVLLRLD